MLTAQAMLSAIQRNAPLVPLDRLMKKIPVPGIMLSPLMFKGHGELGVVSIQLLAV
jgi:hypothetical protein